MLEAALMLYFDPKKRRPKPGAQTPGNSGTVRRLVHVLQQLDLTYDIYGLSGRQILELLPDEFDDWRPQLALGVENLPVDRGTHAFPPSP